MPWLFYIRNHQLNPDTEVLILGTFHPDIATGATFFYGRPRNYLWELLPKSYGKSSLKEATREEKLQFMIDFKVDFADIIEQLTNVPMEQESNYADDYIDSFVNENWSNIEGLIDSLPKLQAVLFTRFTFQNVPNIRSRVKEIEIHCKNNCKYFGLLKSPSRYSNEKKFGQWKNVIINRV